MINTPLIALAAGSLATLIQAAPTTAPLSHRHSNRAAHAHAHSVHHFKRTYNVLGGTGKVAEGWPDHSNWWPSFDEMLEANKDTMRQSCDQWGVPNTTDDEINDISDAIQEVSQSSGVDARFILAIVVQESNGCVRAPTTDNGVTNPGLMQSHNGKGSCNNGEVLTPCPKEQIKQMIIDGTVGTSDGDGLKGCLEQAGGDDVTAYYTAARIYNSGSVAASGNLGQGIATHCYSSDVANRLTGWATGPSSCEPNIIGSLNKAVSSIFRFTGSIGDALTGGGSDDSSDSGSDSSSETQTQAETTAAPTTTEAPAAPTTTEAPAAPSTLVTSTSTSTSTTSTSTYTLQSVATEQPAPASTAEAEPAATSAPASSGSAPIYPYASSSCSKYYTVADGDYCLKVESDQGVTIDQLRQLNPGLKGDCTNLWLGYQYCVKA
ncbi:LysM peptidoglycan-binding domain-containing protein [Aspergillus undulatus]|uniref:LysM peptidoglycan-binding domain-containing protein n=1 Tax=Aspergillus undulatus TaxID=1810928 RepID=UPI003CCE405C